MTPNEIAFVKNFLDKKSLSATFVNLYQTQHWKYNPQSIEKFFSLVESNKVLSQAFYFTPNAKYGVDFWLRQQTELDSYIQRAKNLNEWEWVSMKSQFKLLCYNWDKGAWGGKEQKDVARRRVQQLWAEAQKEQEGGSIINKINTTQQFVSDNVELPKKDPLDELGFTEVFVPEKITARLKKNQASINVRKGSHKITFNSFDTANIINNVGKCYAKLLRNKSGDVVVVLNNLGEGTSTATVKGKMETSAGNIVVNSKEMIEKIRTLLNINEAYLVLEIKEIARTENYIAYQLIKN